jgi:isoleucyl-tRNA synthetase
MALMDQHGADAVRWYMLAAGSPWSARRVGHENLNEVVRKTLLTYWNTVSLHALYAKASNFELSQTPSLADRPLMDKWIISELNLLIANVDSALEGFDSQVAGRELAKFIDDLSNWYVRRSRRRFWDGDVAALATLHECLVTLTQLLAPLVPFITEHVWQELVIPTDPTAPLSVHLSDFPISKSDQINRELGNQVELTRRIVELGRATRAESGIKIRQPLGRALIAAKGWSELPEQMREQIADELNVLELEDIANADGDLVDVSVKANFKSLGAKFGGAVQEIAKAIAGVDPTKLVKQLRNEGSTSVAEWTIGLEDLVITEVPKSGWSVSSHDGESVALDLQLTPSLVLAGNVREVIRFIQERRKSEGFDISDRINIAWNGNPEIIAAIESDQPRIENEVLAVSMLHDDSIAMGDSEIGLEVVLTKSV